jgi:hypothetical protein
LTELKTDTDKVNFYNEKIKELKDKSEEVKNLSEPALDFAIGNSREDVFGGFGMINFSKTPDIDEKGIEKMAEQTISGIGKYVEHLKTDSPPSLEYWNFDNTKYFQDSTANKRLTSITKTDYGSIQSALDDKRRGEDAEPTGNKEIDKLVASQLEALLSTTLVDYLKEIKIDRSGSESQDKYYTEYGNKLFEQLGSTTPAAPPAPAAKPEEAAKATETKTEITPPVNPANPAPAPEPPKAAVSPATAEAIKTEAPAIKQETITPMVTPAAVTPASPAAEATPAATTQTAPAENIVDKTQSNVTNNNANTVTSTVSNTQNLPTTNNQSSPTNIQNTIGAATGGGGEITNLLAGALGIQGTDLVKMMGGESIASTVSGVTNTVTGSIESGKDVVSNVVSQATSAPQAILSKVEQAKGTAEGAISNVARTVSEVPKISEKISMPAVAPKEEEKETPAATPASEPQSAEPTSEGETPKTESPEEKGQEASKEAGKEGKEGDSGELLRIMKEVLRTLQGPLLFSETSQRFH